MIRLIGLLLLMVVSALAPVLAQSQEGFKKHPRVIELEDKYKADVAKYFESRFPQMPYSVEVGVVPLRRDLGSSYEAKNAEVLPFLEVEEIQYRDEWDDPNATVYDLEARIQRTSIALNVPKSIKQDQILEVREALTKQLRLIPGRDEVQVLRKDWGLGPNYTLYGVYAAIGLGVLLFFLLSQFLIQRSSMKSLGKTLAGSKPAKEEEESAGPAAPPVMAAPMSMQGMSAGDSGNGKSSGSMSDNVKFRDPIKTRELAQAKIEDLLSDTFFPSLGDMVTLQKYAKEDLHGFGGLIQVFPHEIQNKVFSYSPDDSWIEAFAEPGEIDQAGLQVIEKMIRNRPGANSEEWHTLLLQVWRMDEPERSKLFDAVDKKEGYAILAAMPKSVAIPIGRKEYPGNWAVLLDHGHKHPKIAATRLKQLLEKSFEIRPKLSKEFLDLYTDEKDLLAYLRKASAQEEREVYDVMENDRFEKLRPPFFHLFEAKESIIEKVYSSFSLEEWSLALFNVKRSDRAVIEKFFGQKEKYLFMEMLKQHDRNKISPEICGAMRERVARVVFEFNKERELRKLERAQKNDSQNQGDQNVAA